jgi:hypothetical protein
MDAKIGVPVHCQQLFRLFAREQLGQELQGDGSCQGIWIEVEIEAPY